MINKLKKLNGASVDSLLLAFMQIVTYLANMVTTKLISISLSLEEYGTYSSVLIVISLTASITLFGFGDCINYFYNKSDIDSKTSVIEKQRFVDTIYFLQCCIGIIAALVLLIFSGNIAQYFNNSILSIFIKIVCFKPLFENLIHLYQVLFVSTKNAKIIAIRNFIIAIIKILTVIIALMVLKNLKAIFIILIFVDAIQILFFCEKFKRIRFFVNPVKFDSKKIKIILQYGLPMGIFTTTNTLMKEVDKLIIGNLTSTTDLAIYSNCSKLLPINIFVTAFATVLVPYIMKYVSGKKYKDATHLYRNYLTLGYLSIWMFAFAIILCSEDVIKILYSSEYLPGKYIFIIYLVDSMVQFASMHLIIAANGDSKYLMTVSLCALSGNIALNFALFYLFKYLGLGIIGPAVSTLIITICYTATVIRKTLKILGVNLVELMPVKEMLCYLLELFAVAIPLYFLRKLFILWNINYVLICLIICALFCLINMLIQRKKYFAVIAEINKAKM